MNVMLIKNYIALILLVVSLPFLASARELAGKSLSKQAPLDDTKNLLVDVNFGNGYIDIRPGTENQLFGAELFYEGARPEVKYERIGEDGRLHIYFSGNLAKSGDEEGASKSISSLNKMYENSLNLLLTDKIVTDMDLELGVIKGTIDLSGLRIRQLKMQIGVIKGDLLFNKPNPVVMEGCFIEGGVGKFSAEKLGNANFDYFSFEGGVGSYVLDFSGEYRHSGKIKIEMGMGKLLLYLPRKVGTRIRVEKSILASVDIDEVYKKGKFYYNDNWEQTEYSLDVEIETGVGKINIVWVDD